MTSEELNNINEERENSKEKIADIRAPRRRGTSDGNEGRLGSLHRQSLRENTDSGTTGRTSGSRYEDSADDEAA